MTDAEVIELLRELIRSIKIRVSPTAYNSLKKNGAFPSKTAKDVYEMITKFEKDTFKNEKNSTSNRKKT